jgi:hypothetical protein
MANIARKTQRNNRFSSKSRLGLAFLDLRPVPILPALVASVSHLAAKRELGQCSANHASFIYDSRAK